MQAVKTGGQKSISIIPAKLEFNQGIRHQIKRLRVAAYCRVSTLQEQQESSYEAQVAYYTNLITDNPHWMMAGIYADDGKSGTMIQKRDDFQMMMEACMAGKIDMIITKSVSRFARNTVDSLTCIRKLKERNIAVFFEKEQINTLESGGELLITILSSQAQEESRNLSENVHWGFVRQFENGVVHVNHSKFLGYTKGKDGNLAIVPEEAELVRRIFRLFLQGSSSIKIANQLEAEGIKTVTGKTKWHPTVIDKMLSNEKYMGDALLQKTYTVDFLTKKKVMNKGIVPQYYVEDNHEAIIPKELFYKVQEEKARRANIHRPNAKKKNEMVKGRYSCKYVLSDIMICKECGQPYRRQVWSKNGSKKVVWRCDSRLKHGTKKCKNSPTMEEKTLHEAIMEAVNAVIQDGGEFVEAFRENVIRIIGSYSAGGETTEYDKQIEIRQQELLNLIEESSRSEYAEEAFDKAYLEITDEIRVLKKKRMRVLREKQMAEAYEQRVEGMEDYVKKTSYLKRQFDDELVRQLLQIVKVVNANKIEIQYRSGIVMGQRVDYYD